MTPPRPAATTITAIDAYAQAYQSLFSDVRSYNHFKQLLLGLMAEIPRKSLPAIARAVGADAQALHHFLCDSPWQVSALRKQRLHLLQEIVGERSITVCIDETGDKKKGKTTDYVDRQYLGNVGKIDSGIVSVNAYGYLDGLAFPLLFRVFKPKKRLRPEDKYLTKPEIAGELIEELIEAGFTIKLVLADSIYGESNDFVASLESLKLKFILATRCNHVPWWLPSNVKVECQEWQPFTRVFSDGKSEQRYIRELVFVKRCALRYYQVTTDKEELPEDTTWRVRTNLREESASEIGNQYGLRTWIEYGFRQVKSELGWTDYRLTSYEDIEKWWEVIFSAYTMVCLESRVLSATRSSEQPHQSRTRTKTELEVKLNECEWWKGGRGWKQTLNRLRLLLQPYVCWCLLVPWLKLFDFTALQSNLLRLLDAVNSVGESIPV